MKETRSRRPTLRETHVVVLINYLRAHHVSVFEKLEQEVGKLTLLLSTPVESSHGFEPNWGGLDVRVQKNWTWEATWRHSQGFSERNFIHVPRDTVAQLESLQPDIVFSYEFGMRSLLASRFRRRHPEIPLVIVGNMSERIECERGWLRRRLRRHLVGAADAFTWNGPSCRRYLAGLGIPDEQLFPIPYAVDPDKCNHGPRSRRSAEVLTLLWVGNLQPRKGARQLADGLQGWIARHPHQRLRLVVCGDGPERPAIAACQSNQIEIDWRGWSTPSQVRAAYAEADIFCFPTLADEWGMVAIEAMASGIPVLGSRYAQSIETLGQEGINGWYFRPDQSDELGRAMDAAFSADSEQLARMGEQARRSVADCTPERSARCFIDVIDHFRPAGGTAAVPGGTSLVSRGALNSTGGVR